VLISGRGIGYQSEITTFDQCVPFSYVINISNVPDRYDGLRRALN